MDALRDRLGDAIEIGFTGWLGPLDDASGYFCNTGIGGHGLFLCFAEGARQNVSGRPVYFHG